MAKQNPTAAELRAVFSYDAHTGAITRISTGRQCGSKHSAGYLEVYALGGKSKRFYASIKVGARRIHLGSFLDADSAQAAYNEAKLKHHGLVLN